MKVLSAFKYIYVLLAFGVIFGFTFNAGNSKINKNETIINSQQADSNWVVPPIADKIKNPLKDDLSATEKGEKTFKINCVTCHGDKGYGNGPGSAGLVPKPANLTSDKVQSQTDGAIYYKITKGRNAMLSWQYTLSSKQRWQLVNYIRELGKKEIARKNK